MNVKVLKRPYFISEEPAEEAVARDVRKSILPNWTMTLTTYYKEKRLYPVGVRVFSLKICSHFDV